MFTRRSFFKKLGGAILGTAIALNIPEALIPQLPSAEADYEFGWTGYAGIKGMILAEVNLQIVNPRIDKIIYIENC